MKVRPGLTVDHDNWKPFKQKYNGKNGAKTASQRINELMAEDLEKETQKTEILQPLKNLPLTPKQKELLKKILGKNSYPLKKREIGQIANRESIYSRRDHIKEAVQTLGKTDGVPLQLTGKGLEPLEISCSCEASIPLKVAVKEKECPKCGNIIDFEA